LSEPDEQTPSRMVAGRYRIDSVLGRGGMGVVWLADDTLIERQVALKELRAPTGVSGGDESSFVERALREARNAGRLNHPGIVAVHDVIAPAGDDDAVYIVMEYVPAPTLADLIDQQGPLPAPRVATMGLGILDALMAAHAMGIVHRDIKPANVLVREGDRVKLTDFGIALAAEDTRLTRSGVIGTHGYLAPECFDTGQAGPASDLWALGATLFHAVAGRAPFDRETTTATLRAILFEDPPAPPCKPPLANAITRLLIRPLGQRLTSDAARQLLQHASTEPVDPSPTGGATATGGTGHAAWDAQATTLHRQPPPPPLGGQPSPYGTRPPTPPARPVTGVIHGTQQASPPPRPNHTPWIILGCALAAVATVALPFLLASGGGGSDPEANGSRGGGSEASSYTAADHDAFIDMCSNETSDISLPQTGEDPCECVWNATVEIVPHDVFREAMDSGTSPTSLPPDVQQAYSSAVAGCLPVPP
jgi:serine/threonine protein kinase